MSEPKHLVLEAINYLQSNKTRPNFQRISGALKRKYGIDPDRTRAELNKLIQENKVLEVDSKGSISYWNAEKRKPKKKRELSCDFIGEQAKRGTLYNSNSTESFMDYEAIQSSFNNSDSPDRVMEYEDQETQRNLSQEHWESQDSLCNTDMRHDLQIKKHTVIMDQTFQEKLIDEVHRIVRPWLGKEERKRVPKVHQKSWEEIALRLGKDATTCSKTWKNLKDDYVKAKKKGDIIPPGSILEKMEWLSPIVMQHELKGVKRPRMPSPSSPTDGPENSQFNMPPTKRFPGTGLPVEATLLELSNSSDSLHFEASELRIMLLGKIGVGKSSTGNTILGKRAFDEDFAFDSITATSLRETAEFAGRQVTVIDTPGPLFDSKTESEKKGEIEKCVKLSVPGPHVFLLVIRLGVLFSEKEKNAVKWIQENFGKRAKDFTMVLITHGDVLKGRTMESVLTDQVRALIDSCGGRYHVFNNAKRDDQTQVKELLEKIDELVEENDGYYTNRLYQDAQRNVREEEVNYKMKGSQEKFDEVKPTMNTPKGKKHTQMEQNKHTQREQTKPCIQPLGSRPTTCHDRKTVHMDGTKSSGKCAKRPKTSTSFNTPTTSSGLSQVNSYPSEKSPTTRDRPQQMGASVLSTEGPPVQPVVGYRRVESESAGIIGSLPSERFDRQQPSQAQEFLTVSRGSKPQDVPPISEPMRKTLDELSETEFKRFKHILRENSKITWSKLETARRDDVVYEMEKCLVRKCAVTMMNILLEMNENHLATNLKRELDKRNIKFDATRHPREMEYCSASVSSQGHDMELESARERISKVLKEKIKTKIQYITEGNDVRQNKKLLNQIYTKLYIIEGETRVVDEHEITQIDAAAKMKSHGKEIECNNIFQKVGCVRTVLTKGNAGIGKTVCVQKFILDWVEGEANHNIKFVFILPFRELNLLEGEFNLLELLVEFHRELNSQVNTDIYDSSQTLFILDGLDESRFRLDFTKKMVADMKTTTTVDVLITSLIKGKLLESALLWITSRPAAVTHGLLKYIDQITEVRGFSDPQKVEYFRKRISNPALANSIIQHIKSSRVLHIMCHIPLFCWITATVFQRMLDQGDKDIPKTLTSMYCHFLLIQTDMTHRKNQDVNDLNWSELLDSNRDVILKVAKLAFTQLGKDRVIFGEKDLMESGIGASDSFVSGMCTEILKEESNCYLNSLHEKMYYFVHLSIQEFLAALFAFHCYLTKNLTPLKAFLAQRNKDVPDDLTLEDLLKIVVNKALDSKNGHFDLFVRFLHGLSLQSNQRILGGLLPIVDTDQETMGKIINNLKKVQRRNISAERCMNLFHCLSEMNDSSLHQEVQQFLRSENSGPGKMLSLAHCSALAYMLQLSDDVQGEFDLTKYNTSDEGRKRLVPAVKNCHKAVLAGCKLTESSCDIVATALQSANSSLRELDLSDNDLQDSGVEILCSGLKSTNCKLEKLSLSFCGITKIGCENLASALSSNPSYLRELNLSQNYLGREGKDIFSKLQKKLQCKTSLDSDAEYWLKSGLRKYSCKITLNPNTAHQKLCLRNQKVTVEPQEKPYPDHPERFQHCQQVLCSEGLTSKAYWEVDWNGHATIGVAYKSICRDIRDQSRIGCNDKSWGLERFITIFSAKHNNSAKDNDSVKTISVPRSNSGKLGVFLDWHGGTLSFYTVSSGALSHLHTFHAKFVEPVYPVFEVSESVNICQPRESKRQDGDC